MTSCIGREMEIVRSLKRWFFREFRFGGRGRSSDTRAGGWKHLYRGKKKRREIPGCLTSDIHVGFWISI
jgi:hypothetical protein